MPAQSDCRTVELIDVARWIAEDGDAGSKALPGFAACIEPLMSSPWQDVVWRSSGLNVDGCPVEFTFSSRDRALRCTTEVAGPQIDEHARLTEAWKIMRRLHHPQPMPELMKEWQCLQKGTSLRWGAWLGFRHDGRFGRTKLYIEVPQAARKQATIAAHPPLPGGELVMIGFDPSLGYQEVYFRHPPMINAQRDAFMARLSNTAFAHALPAAVEELCAMPFRSALNWITLAYSMICGPANEPHTLSFFLYASTLGKPVQIRRRILQCEASHGAPDSLYRQMIGKVSEQLLPKDGTISLIAHPSGEVEVRTGLSGIALAIINQACKNLKREGDCAS